MKPRLRFKRPCGILYGSSELQRNGNECTLSLNWSSKANKPEIQLIQGNVEPVQHLESSMQVHPSKMRNGQAFAAGHLPGAGCGLLHVEAQTRALREGRVVDER